MPTLLLNSRFTDDSQSLWRACLGTDWKVERVYHWQVPEIPPSEAVIYGEPLFAQHMASALKVELLSPPADWLSRLDIRWTGRLVQATSLGAARQHPHRAFFKPAEDKCFDARIYNNGNELPAPGTLPDELPVLIQGVVQWAVEYRCFVVNHQVATLSPYWRGNASAMNVSGDWPAPTDESEAARSFCERMLNDSGVPLPEAVVVDVGVIEGHGWAVVESNAVWGAGIYGCDALDVLKVLRAACKPAFTAKS